MKLLAIDPGEKVGWAVVIASPDTFNVASYGITPLKDFALKLGDVYGSYDEVVYEQWRLRPSKARVLSGNDMQPSQLVGMIRYIGWLSPNVKLVGQAPSIMTTARKTMNDEVRALVEGAPATHDEAHYADALLHAWHRVWRKYVTQQTD